MKSVETNKLALRVEKRSSFKTKEGITIRTDGFIATLSGNNLAKFQPNWSSGCRLGVKDVRTTRQNFTFKKKRRICFLRCLASNEIMTPKYPVISEMISLKSQTIEFLCENNLFASNTPLSDVSRKFVIFIYLRIFSLSQSGFHGTINICYAYISWNADQVDKDAENHSTIHGKSSTQPLLLSPVEKMNSDRSLPIYPHSLSGAFLSFSLGLKDKNRYNRSFLGCI